MRQNLRDLINLYIAKANELFNLLLNDLKLESPKSNLEWTIQKMPNRGVISKNVEYYRHGYGCWFKYNQGEIDFDLDKKGEINGFNAYWLFEFAKTNNIEIPYQSAREIQYELDQALSSQEIIKSNNQYIFNVPE